MLGEEESRDRFINVGFTQSNRRHQEFKTYKVMKFKYWHICQLECEGQIWGEIHSDLLFFMKYAWIIFHSFSLCKISNFY